MKLVGKEKTTSLIIYRQVWSSNDIYPFYLKPWFITKGGPQACNFVKSKLQHRCFPVNIAKFFRELFFKLLTIFAKSTITGLVLNTPLCIYLLGLTYSLWWRLFQTTIHCQRIWIVCIHWISLLLLHSDIITSL